MKTVKSKIETELIASDDGKYTYEVIKRLEGVEGECGYLISLYPTRTEGNIHANDSTLNHLICHMQELGFNELHLINLFSIVVSGKLSTRGLQIDTENMCYIEALMSDKKFQSSKFIIAWGNSLSTSHTVQQSKTEIFKLFKKYCPKNKLYQLTAIDKAIESNVSPHPLYLGIRAAESTWGLQEFKLTSKMLKPTETENVSSETLATDKKK